MQPALGPEMPSEWSERPWDGLFGDGRFEGRLPEIRGNIALNDTLRPSRMYQRIRGKAARAI